MYLRIGQPQKIRNEFIRSFSSFGALQDYISQAEDKELGLMVEIVSKYGQSLFDCMRRLKEAQVPKELAEIIFSTVHKAKGAEFSQVEILDGFITGEKINSIIASVKRDMRNGDKEPKQIDYAGLAEEVNILYVCLTRTKNVLKMNFDVEHGPLNEMRIYGKEQFCDNAKAVGAV